MLALKQVSPFLRKKISTVPRALMNNFYIHFLHLMENSLFCLSRGHVQCTVLLESLVTNQLYFILQYTDKLNKPKMSYALLSITFHLDLPTLNMQYLLNY